MQFKKNGAARVFFYLDVLAATVASIVLKRVDSGSTDFETLTYTTNYTCDEMSGGWYACDIVASVLDTIGETLLEFSYTGSNPYYCSVDVVDNLVSDNATTIGTPVSLDSGVASLAGMLTKIADDSGGTTYEAGADSMHTKTGSGLTAQQTRDAMLLAATAPGIGAEDSIDDKLDDIPTSVATAANATTIINALATIDSALDTALLALTSIDSAIINIPTNSTIKTLLSLPTGIKKNVAYSNFTFPMFLSTDHCSLATGKTITGTIRKDNGNFSALSNSISEIGTTGMFSIDITQTEMNADSIGLLFSGVDCDDLPIMIDTNV